MSSVSLWVRDIVLTADQEAHLRSLNPRYNNQLRGGTGRRESARRIREAAQQQGREMARAGDPLHQAGCLLHWAEGSKSRSTTRLTNSDPDLLRLFRRFLRECYDIPDERITLTGNFHLGNGLTVEEIYGYWLTTLDLPPSALRKPSIVPPSSDLLKRRRLPYGTVSLTICSVLLTQSIYGAIQEYAGFDRPAWLD